MRRNPLWYSALMALGLLFSLVYSAPNFFGRDYAIEVMPRLETPLSAIKPLVTERLQKAGISPLRLIEQKDRIVVLFADDDSQLRAKEALETPAAAYTAAVAMVSRTPTWLSALGAKPMTLGLDLQGGVHFLLEVDATAIQAKALDDFLQDARGLLRSKRLLAQNMEKKGKQLVFAYHSLEAASEAQKVLKQEFPDWDIQAQGTQLLIGLKKEALQHLYTLAVEQNLQALRNRVNELGVSEPIVQQQGALRIVVELPGVHDTARAKELLGRTAALEIRLVDEKKNPNSAVKPFGVDRFTDRFGNPILVKEEVILTGEHITDAAPGVDSRNGEPIVNVRLDRQGARIFADVTKAHVGERMAILLVEKEKTEVITAPVIREEIPGGRVQISGMGSLKEATDVALLLRSGALAAPMSIVEERTIGPSLGADNIRRGFYSTVAGFLVIAIFMVFYYQWFGFVSVMALFANLLMLIAFLSVIGATLTLPGMAGIALTIGMAIDANVLIAERIREELRLGIRPLSALASGYDRAFGTILDANVTTFIAGAVLFAFGTGPVRGFAVVLCLGILTSMYNGVFFSRGLANLLWNRRKLDRIEIG